MGLFSGLKRYTHKFSNSVDRYVSKVLGNKAGDIASKITKYGGGIVGPVSGVSSSLHATGHLEDLWKKKEAGVEEQPEQEALEIDMSGVEEALAAMAAYQKLALEASMRQEDAAEPLKEAQNVYDSAQADTNRLQLLRRGLMSTFTRYGGGLGGSRQTLGV